ncbi:hypothetical protein A1332_08675 [Methylomonas methanica]|uniref:Uncharacterized protein n=1 Tax=Methylomonas methanica TaxID=421 RepID=A0A177MP28_METMH|nr:hypothetical protein A1332_08675 [Methylomonas methanica]
MIFIIFMIFHLHFLLWLFPGLQNANLLYGHSMIAHHLQVAVYTPWIVKLTMLIAIIVHN